MAAASLAWFRRDLRLHDNPAWAAATDCDQAVALVVIEPALLEAAGPWRRQAYLAALAGLDQCLKETRGGLWVEAGDPAEIVPRVAAELGTSVVTVNADVTRWSTSRDQRVAEALGEQLDAHWGTVVHPPGRVLTAAGTLSRVFTPFYRRWVQTPITDEVEPGPAPVLAPPPGMSLPDALSGELAEPWSEHDALSQLDRWQERVDAYLEDRDFPATEGTSALSTALRFGLLSPRHAATAVGTHTEGRAGFVRQLAWRDWYTHLTAEHPDIDRVSLRPEYDRIEWAAGPNADAGFEAWRGGMTGYPIVDAAMRELAATGRMHNRLRMITASFLVKDLLIDWRRGERWFRRMLADGDIAQNAGNWQWAAGTGPDAAPYFRVFNPVSQSRKFDPQGRYLRRWLPELAGLGDRDIHSPWQARPLDLAAAGVTLGATYPPPIVDHAEARHRALAAYKQALDSNP
ncbi:MAG: deoxyribodipyrimidine photo-lyase [bacterium]|nr:deoxyribodipyrimidine photo-lyase [bacterium]